MFAMYRLDLFLEMFLFIKTCSFKPFCCVIKSVFLKTLLIGSMPTLLTVYLSLLLNKLLYTGTSVSSSVSVSTSTSNNDEDNKGTILSGWVRSK